MLNINEESIIRSSFGRSQGFEVGKNTTHEAGGYFENKSAGIRTAE
jgi:hypothetical protein